MLCTDCGESTRRQLRFDFAVLPALCANWYLHSQVRFFGSLLRAPKKLLNVTPRLTPKRVRCAGWQRLSPFGQRHIQQTNSKTPRPPSQNARPDSTTPRTHSENASATFRKRRSQIQKTPQPHSENAAENVQPRLSHLRKASSSVSGTKNSILEKARIRKTPLPNSENAAARFGQRQ